MAMKFGCLLFFFEKLCCQGQCILLTALGRCKQTGHESRDLGTSAGHLWLSEDVLCLSSLRRRLLSVILFQFLKGGAPVETTDSVVNLKGRRPIGMQD